MPHYRRAQVPGGTFFFTVVVHKRRRILSEPPAPRLLGEVLRRCRDRWPFAIEALVLLPDHLHSIWTLPPGDFAYPRRWAWIKKEFTKDYVRLCGDESTLSPGRMRERRRGIWQSRYWEHTLESEEDFDSHFDYIHYNPVRHGEVRCPHEWPWSTFHRHVRKGIYPPDWGCGLSPAPDFGAVGQMFGE